MKSVDNLKGTKEQESVAVFVYHKLLSTFSTTVVLYQLDVCIHGSCMKNPDLLECMVRRW
jgi:hypothetical protein